VPLPCPDTGESPDSHSDDADTSQGHSGVVVTVSVPAPPSGPTLGEPIASATWHFTALGLAVVVSEFEPHPAASAAIAIAANGTRKRRRQKG
jgi:hypothetical protein